MEEVDEQHERRSLLVRHEHGRDAGAWQKQKIIRRLKDVSDKWRNTWMGTKTTIMKMETKTTVKRLGRRSKTKNMKHHRVVVGDPSRSLN